MSYSAQHLKETAEIVSRLNPADCEKCVAELRAVRERGGRLFILGVGGSAANASHAVNDFRKIAGLECYAPTDNVSELTARTNDEGWATVFVEWLRGAASTPRTPAHPLRRRRQPGEKRLAQSRHRAPARQAGRRARRRHRRQGRRLHRQGRRRLRDRAHVNPNNITPHSEAFQAVIWHLFVSHPDLKAAQTKWESLSFSLRRKASGFCCAKDPSVESCH
jgi:D-sedoheptulose 7-phosphate isomerase